ncbi:hypothetical protein [Paracoccus sp. AS002]|uniref:hypothetical protein n=1 Tax=Paracoccus sp. AS002 TaxID=3019545 RepID=UPI0023E89959|nr:hypothetical protein [Paracoccus sp. AS002]MDF3904395.1 hypothetical protein [Paracoccus sp. AS002]
MFDDIGDGPGIFAAGGKPLHAAGHRQQDRRPDADRLIAGQQADGDGRDRHQQHRQGQDALAADPIAHHAEIGPADGAKRKGNREDGEGLQQPDQVVAFGKEGHGQDRGHEAVDGEVKPFDHRARDRGGRHLSQGGGIGFGSLCHAKLPLEFMCGSWRPE